MNNAIAIFGIYLMSPAPAATEPCGELDQSIIRSNVEAILRAPDWRAAAEQIYVLDEYWFTRCVRAREAANRSTVALLARLLQRPATRFAAASLLADVGPNLRYARPEVERALRHQMRIDRRARRTASGLLPGNYQLIASSLNCVLTKIQTGLRDRVLCRAIDSSLGESDPPA
jgi:hypothetical protein